jgi:TetR/AcrR family transcriptional repressor of nem operon
MGAGLSERRRRLTPRGEATRARIVLGAAGLIYEHGAERVSLDHVMEETGVSKSQLYHYFKDKDDLIREVIRLQTAQVIDGNHRGLKRVDTLQGLRTWRNSMVRSFRKIGAVGGCPVGSLANELAGQSEDARRLLDQSFAAWSAIIEDSLVRMRENGELASSAQPAALATAVLAAIQGGILLAKTARSARPLELAFDMALDFIAQKAIITSNGE